MKVAILAGGMGTRLAEETETKPKPMVEIGGRPILWHIMKLIAHQGFREFAIALGYKGDQIKRWLADYRHLHGDLSVELRRGEIHQHNLPSEDWLVHCVDTGQRTGSGGRLKRLEPLLGDGTFLVAFGDGLSTLDLRKLLDVHRAHGRLATIAAVHPPSRFGRLELAGDQVIEFAEKRPRHDEWINGGFFAFEPGVLDYIEGDDVMLEGAPLEGLAADGQLVAYRHAGFWQCMDTIEEKRRLEALWAGGDAPWKVWE